MGNTKSADITNKTDITNQTDITNIDLIKEKYNEVDGDDLMVKFAEYLSRLDKHSASTEQVNTIMTEVYQITKYLSYEAEEDRLDTIKTKRALMASEDFAKYDYDEENKDLTEFVKNFNNILAILEKYTEDFSAIVATKDESRLNRQLRLISEKIHEGNESLKAEGEAITNLSNTIRDGTDEFEILFKVRDISKRMKRGERPTKVEQLLLMVNLNIASRQADEIYEKKEKGESLREMEQKMIETFTYKETNDFPDASLDKLKEFQKKTFESINEGQTV